MNRANKNDYETLERFTPHQGQPNPKVCADNRKGMQLLRRTDPALPAASTNPPEENCSSWSVTNRSPGSLIYLATPAEVLALGYGSRIINNARIGKKTL